MTNAAFLRDDTVVLPARTVRPQPTIESLREAAQVVARAAVADAVADALDQDPRSLRRLCEETGLDPAFVSKLANGAKGANVTSVALVALALGKSLSITIE